MLQILTVLTPHEGLQIRLISYKYFSLCRFSFVFQEGQFKVPGQPPHSVGYLILNLKISKNWTPALSHRLF